MDVAGLFLKGSNPSLRRRIIAGILLAVWFASLITPAILSCGVNAPTWSDGWLLLLMGWIGPLVGQFAWFANPAFSGAVVLMLMGQRVPVLLALAVAGLAALVFTFTAWPPIDVPSRVCGHGPGFDLWLAAMVGTAVFAIVDRLQSGPKPATVETAAGPKKS